MAAGAAEERRLWFENTRFSSCLTPRSTGHRKFNLSGGKDYSLCHDRQRSRKVSSNNFSNHKKEAKHHGDPKLPPRILRLCTACDLFDTGRLGQQ